jgi:hypothetical protein
LNDLHVLEYARALMITIRRSTSTGASTGYVQITRTAGTLIHGKMSTFITAKDKLPSTSVSSAITPTEIGLFNATRTSHIIVLSLQSSAA